MLHAKKWVLYDFVNKSDESIADRLSILNNAGISALLVHPEKSGFSIDQLKVIATFCKGEIDCFVVDNPVLAKEIGASGLFFSTIQLADWSIKESHPNLIIGGRAHSLADCKNFELMDADFLTLVPAVAKPLGADNGSIPGSEIFSDIVPQEEVYGWMVSSLNIPVIAEGVFSLEELTRIVENANTQGVLISDTFCPTLDRSGCISAIRKTLN